MMRARVRRARGLCRARLRAWWSIDRACGLVAMERAWYLRLDSNQLAELRRLGSRPRAKACRGSRGSRTLARGFADRDPRWRIDPWWRGWVTLPRRFVCKTMLQSSGLPVRSEPGNRTLRVGFVRTTSPLGDLLAMTIVSEPPGIRTLTTRGKSPVCRHNTCGSWIERRDSNPHRNGSGPCIVPSWTTLEAALAGIAPAFGSSTESQRH